MSCELEHAYNDAVGDIIRLEDEIENLKALLADVQKSAARSAEHSHLMANVAGIMTGVAAGLAAAIALTVYLK